MLNVRLFRLLSRSCFLALSVLLFGTVVSCPGTGTSINMEDNPYTGGGTSPSVGSGGSGSFSGGSGGTSNIGSSMDFLSNFNAGDVASIVARFSSGSTGSGTGEGANIVIMSAADLGLPAGGTVTLTISELGYAKTAVADANGMVSFAVPPIETGITVTVGLSVNDSDGFVIFSGSQTQVVDDGCNMEVKLVRQGWSIPDFTVQVTAPATLTSSPDGAGGTVYLVTDSDMMGKSLSFQAVPGDGGSFPAETTFTWSFDAAGTQTGIQESATLSAVAGGGTTAPLTETTYTVSCMATCGERSKGPRTAAVKLNFYLTPDGLDSFIAGSVPHGNADSPTVLPPVVFGSSPSMNPISLALSPLTDQYVDLSGTVLPEDIGTLLLGFYNSKTLVKAPVLPASATDLGSCFSGCTALTTAPVIPAGVSSMQYCFSGCTALTSAPVIPAGVTDMQGCFSGCTALTAAPVIPAGVTNMKSCFSGCTNLSGTVIINATGVTDWTNAFLTVDASKITAIKVRDAATKTALQSAISNAALKAKVLAPGDPGY